MSRAAAGCPGRASGRLPPRHDGGGLECDDRFVVERFRALACGDIRPVQPETASTKGRRKSRRTVVSRKEAEAMRPDCTEIIIITGLRSRGGKQAWGLIAAGILCDRKQKC